jgi:hypothetical protein
MHRSCAWKSAFLTRRLIRGFARLKVSASHKEKSMKPLKFFVAACLLSSAPLVFAQTQTQADGASAPQAASAPNVSQPSQECVGPASFCTPYFGS